MYSNNDGESWVESDSNTYTFTDLSDTTEYKIRVKVVDSNGVESTEYYEAIATETYILPVVARVDATTTYNSITLTPIGTNGTNTIDHYLYSIDNGEYQESNVFNNLNEQTEYTINVKAIDSDNRESNPYTIQVTTDTYEIPVITNVSTSSTEDSITINVSANNGDGTITKYLYSRDNGSNWSESTNNSYTFNNLTSDTTFYIQVKVEDENGRESVVYNTTETTLYIKPVVNSVTTSNITSSSITLTVNATAGTNPIQTYYYSSNNGSSYVSSTSNTYTFSGLSGNTTYNFRVYVVDSNNVASNEATTSATTTYANPVVYSISITSVTTDSITVRVSAGGGTNRISRYYYSINNGSYTNSTSSSYTFSGLSAGRSYSIRVYVTDTSGAQSNIETISAETERGTLLADYIKSKYTSQGANGLYYHTSSLANSAEDNSYRYAGSNPNNYVCFGSDAATCPSANLYRIIGVFGNEVKLIKSTSYGNYVWDSGNSNTWNSSTKPDIRNTLNSTFLNTLSPEWQDKIATHRWHVGGGSEENLIETNVQTAYRSEVGTNSNNTTDNMKIGLMYVSDYYYGAIPTYWTYPGYDYSNKMDYREASRDNWLDSISSGDWEWTISRNDNSSRTAYTISDDANVIGSNIGIDYMVRPCFYLNSDVTYISGIGTSSNPIRIN